MNPITLTGSTPDGRTVEVYACGSCLLTAPGGQQAAERCCACIRCGEDKGAARRTYTTCATCAPIVADVDRRRRRAAAMARPVVEHDGPVYVDDLDRFFESMAEAADYLLDVEHDAAVEQPDDGWLIHPCTVAKAGTPDLTDTVLEAWADNYDDADLIDDLRPGLASALADAQRYAQSMAPDVWRPDLTRRVVAP